MRTVNSLRTLGVFTGLLTTAGCIPAGSNSPIEARSPSSGGFPSVVGINLEGEEVLVPEGFEGKYNLVAVAFQQEQQALVDTWIAIADQLAEETPELKFYELPTIFEANPLFRTWVNNGMRAGITDPTARKRTVTVYLDRERFMEVLQIASMNDIHIFLLDDAGRILWRTHGASNDRKVQSLRDTLCPLTANDESCGNATTLESVS